MNKKVVSLIGLGVLSLMVAGCGPSSTVTSAPKPSHTPSPKPTPKPSPSPSPSQPAYPPATQALLDAHWKIDQAIFDPPTLMSQITGLINPIAVATEVTVTNPTKSPLTLDPFNTGLVLADTNGAFSQDFMGNFVPNGFPPSDASIYPPLFPNGGTTGSGYNMVGTKLILQPGQSATGWMLWEPGGGSSTGAKAKAGDTIQLQENLMGQNSPNVLASATMQAG